MDKIPLKIKPPKIDYYRYIMWVSIFLFFVTILHLIKRDMTVMHGIFLGVSIFMFIVSFIFSKKEKEKKSKFKKTLNRLLFFVFAIIVVILVVRLFRHEIIGIIQSLPILGKMYAAFEAEIMSHSLLGLFYLTTVASLFFILIPVEIIFLVYLSFDFNLIYLILVISLGSLLGQTIDYIFGRVVGENVVSHLLKKKFKKYQNMLENYGGYIIFFGNVFMFPMPAISVIFGAMKFSFKKFILITLLSRIVSHIILFFASDFIRSLFSEAIKLPF